MQQPSTADADRNDHGEIDLSDSDNWDNYIVDGHFIIKPLRAFERVVGEQFIGSVTHVLTTRWSSTKAAINGNMRIVFGSGSTARVFQVVGAIDVEEMRQWIEISAVEQVTGLA